MFNLISLMAEPTLHRILKLVPSGQDRRLLISGQVRKPIPARRRVIDNFCPGDVTCKFGHLALPTQLGPLHLRPLTKPLEPKRSGLKPTLSTHARQRHHFGRSLFGKKGQRIVRQLAGPALDPCSTMAGSR